MNASQGSTSSAINDTEGDRSEANVPNSEDCRDVFWLSCSEPEVRIIAPLLIFVNFDDPDDDEAWSTDDKEESAGLDEIRRGVLDSVGENVAGETGVPGVAWDISDEDS